MSMKLHRLTIQVVQSPTGKPCVVIASEVKWFCLFNHSITTHPISIYVCFYGGRGVCVYVWVYSKPSHIILIEVLYSHLSFKRNLSNCLKEILGRSSCELKLFIISLLTANFTANFMSLFVSFFTVENWFCWFDTIY